MQKTVVSILANIQSLQDQINKARMEMGQLNMFSREISSIANDFSLDRDAHILAKTIADRDFPLTRNEITSIFETSGFEFTSADIDASNPDGDKATQAYRNEMAADYASVYGWED